MIYHGSMAGSPLIAPYRLESDLSDLSSAVATTTADLARVTRRFGSIVCCGMSGVLVAAPVSLALHKPLIVVRKDGDIHHSNESIINIQRIGKRWLFLDDFTAGGRTFQYVNEMVEDEAYQRQITTRRVGGYYYRDHELCM